jgi:hypothetical protein
MYSADRQVWSQHDAGLRDAFHANDGSVKPKVNLIFRRKHVTL